MVMVNKSQDVLPWKIKAVLTLLLPLALASCSDRYFNGERHFGLEFEKECALSRGQEMMDVFGGGGVYVVDSLLIVTGNNQTAGYFWNVYDRHSGKFIKSMLRHGRGPSEVLYPAYNGQYEYEDGDIVAYFYDSGLSKVLKINITESLDRTDDVIEDVCGLGYDSYPYYIDSDGKTISSLYVQEEGALSLDGMQIYRNISPEFKQTAAFNLSYNPTLGKVCLTYSYADQVQILDMHGKGMLLSPMQDSGWENVIGHPVSGSTKICYGTLRTTDSYIYAGYIGRTLDGMMEDGGAYCSEIHVFDWNGKAVARIIPDRKTVSFDVDPSDSVIYCMTDEEKILEYPQ